jgi:hypothetical protein
MKRIKLVLAALVVVAAAFAAFAGPAMARGNGVSEERGESARVQANEERGFNHNFLFNRGFNNGGLIISNGNVVGLNSFGLSGLNNCGWNWNCNNGLIF